MTSLWTCICLGLLVILHYSVGKLFFRANNINDNNNDNILLAVILLWF